MLGSVAPSTVIITESEHQGSNFQLLWFLCKFKFSGPRIKQKNIKEYSIGGFHFVPTSLYSIKRKNYFKKLFRAGNLDPCQHTCLVY